MYLFVISENMNSLCSADKDDCSAAEAVVIYGSQANREIDDFIDDIDPMITVTIMEGRYLHVIYVPDGNDGLLIIDRKNAVDIADPEQLNFNLVNVLLTAKTIPSSEVDVSILPFPEEVSYSILNIENTFDVFFKLNSSLYRGKINCDDDEYALNVFHFNGFTKDMYEAGVECLRQQHLKHKAAQLSQLLH